MVTASPAMVAEENAAPRRGGAFRWLVVAILFVGYCFSAIDARVLTLMVEPIQNDLGLTDFEMGLLQGFAFSILYSMAALPIGRYVDRAKRRSMLIFWGVLFWSLMTAMCGFASSFVGLFIARVGVGVGEATLSPTAYSLISDYFERKRRALAISFYAIGYPIGGGLALLIGGWLITHFTKQGGLILPLLGDFEPWQAVFLCVAAPGILVAAAMLLIREPPRQELAKELAQRSTLREGFDYVMQRKVLFGSLIGSLGLIALLAIGTALWFPTFLIRTYAMSPGEVGMYYGGVMLVCGTIGTLFGGWLSGRLMHSGRADANMRIVLFSTLLKGFPLILAPLMPTATLALAMMGLGTLIGQASQGVMLAAIQDVTPNQLRGQVTAIALLAVNLLGMGLGASVIAAITDFGFGDQGALRYSIAITGAVTLPLILVMLVAALPHYRRAVEQLSS
ncbi:MFS transporter [Pelagerythrobacter rhizovicinus]|uniref:MFS transporter n=1 Tax=Pelagerythrobacter rhizovicinus TaxID=2268576 RepID=A0A4Q2KQ51_9SPHN|nr:MFS transporter [Pelagerythrobacter rhizovicinus]RXZ65401.1 MFS transporter [Pelagerythrobacter rhizovicinus]